MQIAAGDTDNHEAAAPLQAAYRQADRNGPCPCDSGAKFKRCCLGRYEAEASVPLLPGWLLNSTRKLHQFQKYACKVYGLARLLGSFNDRRRSPSIPTLDVVSSLFHAAVLRRPSLNAIEGDLKRADYQMVIGRKPNPGIKVFSAEVLYNVLDKLDLGDLRRGIEDVIWKAERNKVFREGSFGALRCVAIDGWEPFCSYHRHCDACLTRDIQVKDKSTGQFTTRTQYYHRYVVAMLIGRQLDVILDIEPVRGAEARDDLGEDCSHEGELTAAHRLVERLHTTYATFIDALVCDALYANGPWLTKLDQCGYGGFIVLKNDNHQPLKDAHWLWQDQKPCAQYYDEAHKAQIDFWDANNIDALKTYKGKVRVIRAVITRQNGTRKTWCFGIVGNKAQKVSCKTALRIVRGRWHIENTGFGQWVKHWHLGRVYRHSPNGIEAVLLLWMFVFNLLQLFVYRRLKRTRRPKDPCDTIISIIAEMSRDLGAIPDTIPWEVLANADRPCAKKRAAGHWPPAAR